LGSSHTVVVFVPSAEGETGVMQRKNFAQILTVAIISSWLYAGFIRLYVLPNYANFLYFLGPFFCLLLGAHSLLLKNSQRSFTVIIALTFYFVLLFQSIHVLKGELDLKILVYGLVLYQLPFFLLSQLPNLQQLNSKPLIEKIIVSSVIPNFVLSLLQSAIPNSSFVPELGASNHLEIANGHVRAFGTFSSTTGFSYYVILLIAVYWYTAHNYRPVLQGAIWLQITGLVVMSGSRTVLFGIIILILSRMILGHGSNLEKKRSFFKIGLFLAISLVSIITFFDSLLSSFQARINLASQQEDTLGRIFDTLFGFLENIDTSLLGTGLGSVSTGAFGYSSDLRWIENDFPRILVECGSILGVLIILARWLLLVLLIHSQKRYFGKHREQRALLIGVLAPLIGYGQFMGQGSLSLGGWITLLLICLIPGEYQSVRSKTLGGDSGT
jgi:hypothetical protein